MADVLILGGTRDIGHFASLALLGAGHNVAVLNRGRSPDELPPEVERVHADRSRRGAMAEALRGRRFDFVLDTTTYNGEHAQDAIDTFNGNVGRYVFISTGQVYLVRAGVERPFRESDFDGPLIDEPEPGTPDHDGWRYGVEKRDAEEIFGSASVRSDFPLTALRIPIVASERDPGGRVQAYVARLLDDGPLLIPDDAGLPLRHLYVGDLARFLVRLANFSGGVGAAYNISPAESLTLAQFITLVAGSVGKSADVARHDRQLLEDRALLPDCSPFSSPWMSELDGDLALKTFGALLEFTSPQLYVQRIIDDYRNRWQPGGALPRGYEQRGRELAFSRESRH